MLKEIYQTRIEYFLKCAESTSFLEAAFKIGISQPALSQAIKKLEDELGTKLFERTPKGIKLSPAGVKLEKELSSIYTSLKQKISDAVATNEKTLIRIGCTGHLASEYFLDVLEDMKKELPTVHLYASNGLDCYEETMKGSLEFSIVAWSSKPARLKSIRVADEPVEFVGLKSHFPDLHKITTLEQLKKYPWVDLPKPQRDWTQLLTEDQNGYIARDVRILRDIVLRGLAVGYLQLSFFTKEERKKLAIAPVPPFYKDVGIYVVYRSDISKPSKEIMDRMIEKFRKVAASKLK
jgi:DNA-binding transcriptional LysR family regulator